MPSLSLITACYNSSATLPATLASVRAQCNVELEYIVVDGGSTDNTVDLLRGQGRYVSTWVSEPDVGIYDALNKGINKATGDIMGFLHADDVFADAHVLQRVAQCFDDPDVEACYGDLVYVSGHDPDKVIRYWRAGEFSLDRLKRGWMPPHPTLYVRRSLYEKLGGFDTRYRIAADYDCMLRLLSNIEGKVVYIPEVLVRMRLGGASNRSLSNIVRKSWEDYRALRRNGVGGLQTLVLKNLSKVGQFVRRG